MPETRTVYLQFKKLPQKAYYEYYFFYKAHRLEIAQLDFAEYIEIKHDFIKALYFMDEYTSLHKEADLLLEEILNHEKFEESIRFFYLETIFWKAKAYLNSNQNKKAILIYKELVKLVPEDKKYRRTLFSLLFQQNYLKEKKGLAVVVLLLLGALFFNAILIFYIIPFYTEFRTYFEIIRNSFFGIGFLLFLFLQTRHIWNAFKEIKAPK
ncbi:MAG: hypothetical protein IPM92_13845 [Saprospiraceae bacterium]|nr:hypothetical protein [Saprospiraceae bacterium]